MPLTTKEANQLCTLRELALAVHAFDRSINECSASLLGRPFNAQEVQAMLKLVRARDPRDIDTATLRCLMQDIQKG